MLYLDASALVPLYVPEAASDEIERIVVSRTDSVVVSPLTLAEAGNVIIRKMKRREIDQNEASTAQQALREHVDAHRLEVLPWQSSFFDQVPILSVKAPVHLRTLDALHLAAALYHRADAMATYDTDLAKAAKALGLRVVGAVI